MSGIVVIFPGIGYNCNKPLLYYGRKLAQKASYDTEVIVEYNYRPDNIFGSQEKITKTCNIFCEEAAKQLDNIKWEQYDKILFISKSIGTAVAVKYAITSGIAGVKHVLYTPLEQTFVDGIHNARAYIGSSDPWSDYGTIKELAEKYNVPLITHDYCNHSLECGDVLENINILKDVMEDTKDFI